MNDTNGHFTHTAFAYQRLGKKKARMLECGIGRLDSQKNAAHVILDRLPIGGFTGYVMLLPHGEKPEPQDSGLLDSDDEDENDEEE